MSEGPRLKEEPQQAGPQPQGLQHWPGLLASLSVPTRLQYSQCSPEIYP